MGRHRDLERRAELLDEVVRYLGRHGVAGVSLRPVARALGVSVNALVHHFGSKDELVVAALRRAAEIQRGVEGRWRRQVPHLSTAELQRRWWRWINRSPEHLALVRLGSKPPRWTPRSAACPVMCVRSRSRFGAKASPTA